MGDTNTNRTAERNREVARGLRESADFLDEHADELPVEFHCYVSHYTYSHQVKNAAEARARLGALARALGEDRAVERLVQGNVEIHGEFSGGVKILESCPVSLLRDAPPEPFYEPILGEQS